MDRLVLFFSKSVYIIDEKLEPNDLGSHFACKGQYGPDELILCNNTRDKYALDEDISVNEIRDAEKVLRKIKKCLAMDG